MSHALASPPGGSGGAHPIEFEGTVKKYGSRTVLNGLNFSVPAGSIVGLLGPNGAGKTTAMRILLGLQRPTAGTVRIMGHEPGTSAYGKELKKVGSILEAPPLYKNVSPRDNLAIRAAAIGQKIGRHEIDSLIAHVGLEGRGGDDVGKFSLGMRQRIGLALAMIGEPNIVILDEPTNGMDPAGAVDIRKLVTALPQRGATALVCTHRLAEVEHMCDYVVVLREGELVTQGSLEDILAAASAAFGHRIEVAPHEVELALRVLSPLALGEITVSGGVIETTRTLPDPSAISHLLADAGIYLRALESHRATLEDAFLELTQEAGR